MNRDRIEARWFVVFAVALLGALSGCSTPAVGAPCLPEQVPENGFDYREAYVESSSVQCETRVCIVYHLDGDPREGCQPVAPNAMTGEGGRKCATPAEVSDAVYCSCRCRSPGGFDECECPDGFSCVDVLEQGGPGVRGGYCVRDGTANQ